MESESEFMEIKVNIDPKSFIIDNSLNRGDMEGIKDKSNIRCCCMVSPKFAAIKLLFDASCKVQL